MAQVKRTKDGRWLLDFEDQYCRRRRIKMKPGTTKNDALQELARHLEDVERGTFVSAKKIPRFKEVADEWLKHRKLQIGLDSWGNHERNVRLHLTKFHNVKIVGLTSAMLQKFMDEKLERGMNRETLRKVKGTLNQTLKYAVMHRYIDYDPMGPVQVLEQREETDKDEVERPADRIRVLNAKQVRGLVEAEKDPKYHCLFMLCWQSSAEPGKASC